MRFQRIRHLLFGTLRRQLVVGLVLLQAAMVSLFVWDHSQRQQTEVFDQRSDHAAALARSVAMSSAVWVASRDFGGLQEIVDGVARYPDLLHAIVLDTKGQVLAHTDASRRGFYLADLPGEVRQAFVTRDRALVDVANPILLGGQHVGWVRVGLGQETINERLAHIARDGALYALVAVAIAAALAILAARHLTRRLYAIQRVADAVREGHSEVRADVGGIDEAAQLARQFNGMLDTLAAREVEAVSSRDALARSESRLKQVMAVTGEGIWDWDLRRNRMRHNPSWCTMLGLDDRHLEHPEAMFTARLHEDDRDAVVARIKNCLDGKGRYQSEHRMYRADGRVIWVQDRGDVVERDAAGRPLRMLGSMIDVSERRQLEDELHRAYAENQAITQAIHDALYMFDSEGRLVWWNRQFETATGLAPGMLRGKLGTEFFVEEDRPRVAEAIGRALTEGYAEIEARMLTRSGPVFYHYNGVHVRDARGQVAGIAGVGRDISDRVAAIEALQASERKLKALNETLEARVHVRTTELRASRDEAERASAAKSEFLSRMSHELRTPLNAILGFGQLLEAEPDRPLSEIQADYVREILGAGEHLLELVNEVLDLSRIESGRLEVSLEAVQATQIIEACLAQIRPLAAKRGIALTLDMAAPCAVSGDRTRIREVLLNLLSNAVKYNREGGRIDVSCAPASGHRLRVSVRDTGRGIAADALPRLFKPFERLESAYEGIEGTGIGLALSKKLVEAMGGDIGVETAEGVGSTFWFELPLADADSPVIPSAALPTSSLPPGLGSKTVLCIEDNAANLRLVEKLVATRSDLRLLKAGCGETGLELARTARPDLVLLDINLPGIDGFEALRRLREDAATRSIPVVALTANAMARDVERGMAAGFDAYVTKPVDVARFFTILDGCLQRSPEIEA